MNVEIIVKNGTKEVKTVIIKKDNSKYIFKDEKAKEIAHIINTNQHTLKNIVEAL